ncbi:MAG TPA: gliding motility-associated C-terminal domain-containing protein, partial [Bacteroidales bacterium]
NFAAFASGGTRPFVYLWNAEHALFDSIQTGLCDGPNNIKITDAKGCVLDSNYVITGLPATDVVIKVSPDSILYMQNPTLSFSFENKSNITIKDWLWTFGDGDTSRLLNPVHTYAGVETFQGDSYPLTLQVKNENGCDTLITMSIPIKAAKLTIPNVITPNSDGQNDKFKIVNKAKEDKNNDGGVVDIEYLRLEVVIFDRWGKLKYESSDYHSDWDGGGLPDGTYFYILKAHGFFRIDKFKGSLTILGSGK